MGGKIPNTIRRQVITQWLYGFSRDQIAKANQIGAGTVSEIIKQCKQKEHPCGNYSEFGLIRELAVMLKLDDVDVYTFASSIRLQRKLEKNGLVLFVMYAKSDLLNHKQITMIVIYIHTLSIYH
jgi:hypothetical protein